MAKKPAKKKLKLRTKKRPRGTPSGGGETIEQRIRLITQDHQRISDEWVKLKKKSDEQEQTIVKLQDDSAFNDKTIAAWERIGEEYDKLTGYYNLSASKPPEHQAIIWRLPAARKALEHGQPTLAQEILDGVHDDERPASEVDTPSQPIKLPATPAPPADSAPPQ